MHFFEGVEEVITDFHSTELSIEYQNKKKVPVLVDIIRRNEVFHFACEYKIGIKALVLLNLRRCFIREYIVIDRDSGEIKEEFNGKRIVGLNDGDRVVRRASVEFLKAREEGKKRYRLEKTSGYINCLSDTFVKVNDFELECIVEGLDVYEKAMLMTMLPYVRYDCSVKKLNGRAVKMKELVKLSGMSQRKAYLVLNSLIGKHIVCKDADVYYVNPWLFFRGNKIDRCLKGMFGEYEIRCRDMTPWREL